MDEDFREGQTIFIDESGEKPVPYKIHFVYSHRPYATEYCKKCGTGKLGLMGRLIQRGFFGDKTYEVMGCLKCQAVTVFIYWDDPQITS